VPAGVKAAQMLAQRGLIHGTEGRSVAVMGRLRAPAHRAVPGLGAAIAVAEETAPSERHGKVGAGAGGFQQRPRQEAAKAEQPGIEGFWRIRHDMIAHGRVHAVGADQEVTLGTRSVREMRDDGLVRPVLDARESFLEKELDVRGPGLLDDGLVQHGAAHAEGGLAEASRHVAVDRAEAGAGLRVEVDRFADRAATHQVGGEAGICEHMHTVRGDLQSAADTGRMRPGLEDLGFDTDPPEQDGSDGAGNAGADDEGLAESVCHGLLLMSQGSRNSRMLNILAPKRNIC